MPDNDRSGTLFLIALIFGFIIYATDSYGDEEASDTVWECRAHSSILEGIGWGKSKIVAKQLATIDCESRTNDSYHYNYKEVKEKCSITKCVIRNSRII